MLKFKKFKLAAICALSIAVLGCASYSDEEAEVIVAAPPGATIDFGKFVENVIVIEKNPSSVVYEYQNVRVDEVSLLAGMYCQDNGGRNAHLEKIILHKNNKRRATFYCSRK